MHSLKGSFDLNFRARWKYTLWAWKKIRSLNSNSKLLKVMWGMFSIYKVTNKHSFNSSISISRQSSVLWDDDQGTFDITSFNSYDMIYLWSSSKKWCEWMWSYYSKPVLHVTSGAVRMVPLDAKRSWIEKRWKYLLCELHPSVSHIYPSSGQSSSLRWSFSQLWVTRTGLM